MNLRNILHPTTLPVFLFRGVASNRLVHLTGRDPDMYENMVNDEIITKYIEKIENGRYDPLRNKTHKLNDLVSCIKDGKFEECTGKSSIDDHIKQGGAIIVKDIGRFSDESLHLHHLLRQIDQIFKTNYSLWCNLYISQEKNALNPHIDKDSVIVLQFKGQKKWDFFGETNDWKTNKPVKSIILNQGDFLYIPKWAPHVAENIPGVQTGHATIEIPTTMDREAKYPTDWVADHAATL